MQINPMFSVGYQEAKDLKPEVNSITLDFSEEVVKKAERRRIQRLMVVLALGIAAGYVISHYLF